MTQSLTGTRPPRQRPWMLWALVAALIALPIMEVWVLIQVGRGIGVLPTILILVAEAFIGAWLMNREGRRSWKALSDAFTSGRMPTGELADGALVLVGGVLLMLPGFVTDIVGFFFLLPLTRPLVRSLLGAIIARQAAKQGVNVSAIHAMRARMQPGTLIEGETVPDAAPGRPDDGRTIRGEVEG